MAAANPHLRSYDATQPIVNLVGVVGVDWPLRYCHNCSDCRNSKLYCLILLVTYST